MEHIHLRLVGLVTSTQPQCSRKGYPAAGSGWEHDCRSKGCERLTPVTRGQLAREQEGVKHTVATRRPFNFNTETFSHGTISLINKTLRGYVKGRRKENKVEES